MDKTILNVLPLSLIGVDRDNLMWWVYMTNKNEETNVLISLLNDPPLSPSWFRSHFLLHIIHNSIIFWWLLSRAILLPKVQLLVVKTTSSSSEGASISTVDLTRSETPATTLQAPSISVSECSLQCCVLVELQNELNMLSKYVAEVDPELKEVKSIATVMDIMKKGKLHRVFSELYILLRLYQTIPLSNATAERSFSALRRVKTYFRSRLTPEHLNHYLMLHCHNT